MGLKDCFSQIKKPSAYSSILNIYMKTYTSSILIYVCIAWFHYEIVIKV